jgi:ATP-dependent exoDNAse (exonuclease V) beta subunit
MREDKERARLLYVGFTRARDHLILAVRTQGSKTKTAWLDALCGADGSPLIAVSSSAADGSTDVLRVRAGGGNDLSVPVRVSQVTADRGQNGEGPQPSHRWFERRADASAADERPKYRIAPSNAEQDWPDLVLPSVGEVVSLGGAMPIDDKVAEFDVLGDAVHAFLAADVEGLSEEERLECARRLVAAAGLTGTVRPEALVGAGDRLRAFVDARWPGAKWLREVPIEAAISTPQGERRVNGSIDLLLDTSDGYVIVDHKTFPGTTEGAWRKKVVQFLPQLAAYRETCSRLAGKRVLGCWVHFPAGGGMVEATR